MSDISKATDIVWGWRVVIGPGGEDAYANLFAGDERVGYLKTHHVKAIADAMNRNHAFDAMKEALELVYEAADADGGIVANSELEWVVKARAALRLASGYEQ